MISIRCEEDIRNLTYEELECLVKQNGIGVKSNETRKTLIDLLISKYFNKTLSKRIRIAGHNVQQITKIELKINIHTIIVYFFYIFFKCAIIQF